VRITTLLPHLKRLSIQRGTVVEGVIHLVVRRRGRSARCPRCHRRSDHLHSRYSRGLADLPIGGLPVIVHLQVRRFRCTNQHCSRRTFVEQVPTLAAPYARRTDGLRAALEQVGLAVGARPGHRLGRHLGLVASRHVLLRLVRRLPEPYVAPARVLGVDEFAVRRGRRYGTVLVDGERHRPMDLLDGRSAEQFAAWLRERPAPEIICRDRAGCYADGARQGAPTAVQVADRYHLLANLGAMVERLTTQHARCWEDDPVELAPLPIPAPAAPTTPVGGGIQQRHRTRYEQIQTLVERRMTITAIGQRLHLDRKTVRKFARANSAEAVSLRGQQMPSSMLRRFYGYLNQRWQEGCQDGAILFAEIHAQGYRGSARTVRRYLTSLRQGQPACQPSSVVAPRAVAGLLLHHPDHLSPADGNLLERLCQRCPELALARRLVQAFAELVCERQGGAALRCWLDQVTKCEIQPLVSFAAGLRRDLAAVTAGVTLPWSSGAVEGHNTRIKLIKRMMYGRGRFDLLKKRVLLAS
jgi:transposase